MKRRKRKEPHRREPPLFDRHAGGTSQEKAAAIAGLDRTDFLAAVVREKMDVFAVDHDAPEEEVNRD